MWGNIIFLIVGFSIGCTFKELLGSKKSVDKNRQPNKPQNSTSKPNQNSTLERQHNRVNPNGFSLYSIKNIFDAYQVPLIDEDSFSTLLRRIQNQCYKNMLKKFIDEANTPEQLIKMLNDDTTPIFDFAIIFSMRPPFISENRLNDYIKKENISPSDIGDNKEKVKFLMTLSHTRGIEYFKKTLGISLTEILDKSNQGENLSDSYEKIMETIKTRYEYLS